MKTFEELEEKYVRRPIRAEAPYDASGILSLAAEDSLVELTSDKFLAFPSDENGWFNLNLIGSSGIPVRLYNALKINSTPYGSGTRYNASIFPNAVLLGPGAHSASVKVISFTLRGLKHFFHYPHVEWQSARRSKADLEGLIRRLREESAKLVGVPVREELFRPEELYIVHSIPRSMKFQVENRFYEVGNIRRSRGAGGDMIDTTIEPVASISFAEPVEFSTALSRVWEWRQFFVQVSLEAMPITALTVRTALSYRSDSADVYLPNVRANHSKAKSQLHPGDVPLNFWEDRKQLRDVMQRWLCKGKQRKTFRMYLGHVIEAMVERSELQDIVQLCSAIESLEEISEKSDITKNDIKLMTKAACAAADENGTEIEAQRIEGVLSLLRQMSLARKLEHIASATNAAIPESHTAEIVKAAKNLRNLAAHGGSLTEERMPIVSPAIQGLAAMCAAFDLLDCGMPAPPREHTCLSAVKNAANATHVLKNIKH